MLIDKNSKLQKIYTELCTFRVNPVSGYVEPERPSPFAGMSEEQKEHEAMKLANLIDRLHNMGIVKPGKLGKLFQQSIKHRRVINS